MRVKNFVRGLFNRGPVSVALAVSLSVFAVTATVGAATTISTNINTGGTLTVTGVSALNGNVQVNGYATTTASNGNIATEGTLSATGASTLTGGVTVGSAGTAVTRIVKGTCSLVANNSIAATSTGFGSCSTGAVTVSTSDIVFVTMATSTANSIGYNWVMVGAQASTTNTTSIEVKLLNLTGTAGVPAANVGFGSSTQYLIIR